MLLLFYLIKNVSKIQKSKNMTKKLANEKEIEKNRLTSNWKNVIQLVSALNVKNAGGALNSGMITHYFYKNIRF